MKKIKINEEVCIGCGTCESLCPEIFRVENGKAKIINENCDKCDCNNIADNCPVSAIATE